MSGAPDPHARLRVSIHGSDGVAHAILIGTPAIIAANTPPGGSWRVLPASVRKLADVRRADLPKIPEAAR